MASNMPSKSSNNWPGAPAAPSGPGGLGDPYHASNNSSFPNYDAVMQNRNISVDSFQPMQRVLSDAETIDLFHNAMYTAREEQLPDGMDRPEEALGMKPLTLDFKRAGVGALPDEAVDIIKRDVGMYVKDSDMGQKFAEKPVQIVLSHNHLTKLPPRFAECTRVTYLNLRANALESFPAPLLKLHLLQILDLSRNKLDVVPEGISSMKALRVLSVSNNNLTSLPYALGGMEALKILKLSGNPLNESIANLLKAEQTAASAGVPVAEHENNARITSQVKKFLRAEAAARDSGDESSSESPVDTPKPYKRNLRFPDKKSGEAPETKPPGPAKPAVPDKSQYRLASGPGSVPQIAAPRQPSGSNSAGGNERARPSGDNITQAAASSRSRRMGMLQNMGQLGAFDESGANRNSLHLRGTSHNSALKGNKPQHTRNMSGAGSTSSADFDRPQGNFFHRLSSLPEQRKAVVPLGAATEGARSLLFSLHSLHPYMNSILRMASTDGSKRSSLQRVFYNSSNQLDALDQALQALDGNSSADDAQRRQHEQNIRRACKACLVAYAQVGRLLIEDAQQLVMNADPRYLRMLLILIYGSTMEAGNAFESMTIMEEGKAGELQSMAIADDLLRGNVPKLTVPSIGPPLERSAATRRMRQDGISGNQTQQHEKSSSQPQSSVPSHMSGQSRSNSRASNFTAPNPGSLQNTPRSGGSFNMPPTPSINTQNPQSGLTPNENVQDQIFEKVLRSFQQFVAETEQAFEKLCSDFDKRLERGKKNNENKSRLEFWTRLATHSHATLALCQNQSQEFAELSVRDTEKRNSLEFWQRVVRVSHSFADFCTQIKLAATSYRGELVLNDAHKAIKPCYRLFKMAMANLENSPWRYALSNSPTGIPQQLMVQTQWPPGAMPNMSPQDRLNGHRRAKNGSGSGSSPYLPTTPLSAALGPAAAATLPASSGPGNFDRSFQGDVFQRAAFALNSQHTPYRRG